jgi:hypothetical protein
MVKVLWFLHLAYLKHHIHVFVHNILNSGDGCDSQQEEHNDKNKIYLKIVMFNGLIISLLKRAPGDQCCHTKYLK